jgi:hypothetical protein
LATGLTTIGNLAPDWLVNVRPDKELPGGIHPGISFERKLLIF